MIPKDEVHIAQNDEHSDYRICYQCVDTSKELVDAFAKLKLKEAMQSMPLDQVFAAAPPELKDLQSVLGPHEGDGHGNMLVPAAEFSKLQTLALRLQREAKEEGMTPFPPGHTFKCVPLKNVRALDINDLVLMQILAFLSSTPYTPPKLRPVFDAGIQALLGKMSAEEFSKIANAK